MAASAVGWSCDPGPASDSGPGLPRPVREPAAGTPMSVAGPVAGSPRPVAGPVAGPVTGSAVCPLLAVCPLHWDARQAVAPW